MQSSLAHQVVKKEVIELERKLVISVIDYCFNEGPKSLNDANTWTGIVDIMNRKGLPLGIFELKSLWLQTIDGKLNEICQTHVPEKEDFIGWKESWSISVEAGDHIQLFGILSKRLNCIYEARLKLRGWMLKCEYKTLKQELKEIQEYASSSSSASSSSFVASLSSFSSSSTTLRPEKVDHEKHGSMSQELEKYSFFVLDPDLKNVVDSSLANTIRLAVKQHGGKVNSELTANSIVVLSLDESYNANFLESSSTAKIKAINRASFIEILQKITSSLPWSLEANVAKEEKEQKEEEKQDGVVPRFTGVDVGDSKPPPGLVSGNKRLADSLKRQMDDASETECNSVITTASFTNEQRSQSNIIDEIKLEGCKMFFKELPSRSENDDWLCNYWKRNQQILYALFFKHANMGLTRSVLAHAACEEYASRYQELGHDNMQFVEVTKQQCIASLNSHWLQMDKWEVARAFQMIDERFKEKLGLTDSCVDKMANFVLAARMKRNNEIRRRSGPVQ